MDHQRATRPPDGVVRPGRRSAARNQTTTCRTDRDVRCGCAQDRNSATGAPNGRVGRQSRRFVFPARRADHAVVRCPAIPVHPGRSGTNSAGPRCSAPGADTPLAAPIGIDERAYARVNTARDRPQAPTRGCVLFHVSYSMLVATPRNVVMVFAVPGDRSGTHRAARRILPPPRCVLNPVAGTGEPTPDAVPRDPGRIGHPPARPHECRAWAQPTRAS